MSGGTSDPLEQEDARFMREALRLAKRGAGRTSPNPAVGAVIVREGSVLAKGYHRRAGLPHAEIEALNRLGGRAEGATLYVTLEPCNHQGRTPPCTQAILRSGLARIVVGMEDPNPGVAGGGCRRLREAGLLVRTGVLAAECRRLNEAFIKHVTTGRPFVALKSALTLDGWTAAAGGHSRWITNERSRRFVHGLRDRADAVMVGVGTVLADDPRLTVRIKGPKGRDPHRIVVDTRLRTPPGAQVLHFPSAAETLLAVGDRVPGRRLRRYRKPGVSLLVCRTRGGKIDLPVLMDILGRRGMAHVLVEGGASLCGSLIREDLVDKMYLFFAPKILGGGDGVPMASGPGAATMDACRKLRGVRLRRFDEDILVEAYPEGSMPRGE